jgi:hypothetical protein
MHRKGERARTGWRGIRIMFNKQQQQYEGKTKAKR